MAEIRVKDRSGTERPLLADNGRPLMESLRDDASLGVLGTCGGMCSCGTCHVFVDPARAGELAPKSEDEEMMLEGIGALVEVRPNSRLSCQLIIDEKLNGLRVEIGPVA